MNDFHLDEISCRRTFAEILFQRIARAVILIFVSCGLFVSLTGCEHVKILSDAVNSPTETDADADDASGDTHSNTSDDAAGSDSLAESEQSATGAMLDELGIGDSDAETKSPPDDSTKPTQNKSQVQNNGTPSTANLNSQHGVQTDSGTPSKPLTSTSGNTAILSQATSCAAVNEVRRQALSGALPATDCFLTEFASIIGDPYSPDDHVTEFFSYRHFRQLKDRVERVKELNKAYGGLKVDSIATLLANDTIKYLGDLQRHYSAYAISQNVAFWQGFSGIMNEENPLEPAANAFNSIASNRYQFENELRTAATSLRSRWQALTSRLKAQGATMPELKWAPIPKSTGLRFGGLYGGFGLRVPRVYGEMNVGEGFTSGNSLLSPSSRAVSKSSLLPFDANASRTYSIGNAATSASNAVPIEFSDNKISLTGTLNCESKQHVYKMTINDHRLVSIKVHKAPPMTFAFFSIRKFSDFTPGQVHFSAVPNKDGLISTLLVPGEYYLRLLSWRDMITPGEQPEYKIDITLGETLREHLTSDRLFVGIEGHNANLKPFRINFLLANNDKITGRVHWPTLLTETRIAGEYIETTDTIKLKFTENSFAKLPPGKGTPLRLGRVYTLVPKVYDGRFVLEGEVSYGKQTGAIRCLAAGLHEISKNDNERKKVIGDLASSHILQGKIELNDVFHPVRVKLVYNKAEGSVGGEVYWPKLTKKVGNRDVTVRITQKIDGVAIDTPNQLILRLVDTQLKSGAIGQQVQNDSTMFYLSPRSGQSGSGFVGKYRKQKSRLTGQVELTLD